MLSAIRTNELIESKILLSRNHDASQICAYIGEDLAGREMATALLERIGFAGCGGPYWKLSTADVDLRELGDRLLRLLGATAAWDLGNVFIFPPEDGAAPEIELPMFWNGLFALHIRTTERCLLFERIDRCEDITSRYLDEYREYLAREFHPAE